MCGFPLVLCITESFRFVVKRNKTMESIIEKSGKKNDRKISMELRMHSQLSLGSKRETHCCKSNENICFDYKSKCFQSGLVVENMS